MKCPRCGYIGEGSYCKKCGFSPRNLAWVCTKCGTYFTGDVCSVCGTPTSEMGGHAYPYKCKKCGLEFGGNVCPGCGTLTSEMDSQKAEPVEDTQVLSSAQEFDHSSSDETSNMVHTQEQLPDDFEKETETDKAGHYIQSHKFVVWVIAFAFILILVIVFRIIGINKSRGQYRRNELLISELQDDLAERDKELQAVTSEKDKMASEESALAETIVALETEKQKEENSPKNRLKRIQKQFDNKEWQAVIENVIDLQNNYPKAQETEKAIALLEKSESMIAEEEERKALLDEKQKSLWTYIGMDPLTVYHALKEQGYSVTVTDRSDDVTGGVGEYILKEGEFGGTDTESNYSDQILKNEYHVTDVKLLNDEATAVKMVLLLNVQGSSSSSSGLASYGSSFVSREQLEKKLDPFDAWVALEEYGSRRYPYGFRVRYILGKIAEEPSDANTWFLKATCIITNAFGQEYETVCEGRVTGTTANPQVVYFYVY